MQTDEIKTPGDVSKLIAGWIKNVTVNGGLGFKDGSVIVQLLHVYLKAYEMEHEEEMEKRLKDLEKRIAQPQKEREYE